MMIEMIVKTAWFKIKNLWPPSHQTMNCICRAEMHNEWLSVHVWITRASEACFNFYLILQWSPGLSLREKRLSLSPYSNMVFLERGKITKGLIKKSYRTQGKNPKAEQSEFEKVLISLAMFSSTESGSGLLGRLNSHVLKRSKPQWL